MQPYDVRTTPQLDETVLAKMSHVVMRVHQSYLLEAFGQRRFSRSEEFSGCRNCLNAI